MYFLLIRRGDIGLGRRHSKELDQNRAGNCTNKDIVETAGDLAYDFIPLTFLDWLTCYGKNIPLLIKECHLSLSKSDFSIKSWIMMFLEKIERLWIHIYIFSAKVRRFSSIKDIDVFIRSAQITILIEHAPISHLTFSSNIQHVS